LPSYAPQDEPRACTTKCQLAQAQSTPAPQHGVTLITPAKARVGTVIWWSQMRHTRSASGRWLGEGPPSPGLWSYRL